MIRLAAPAAAFRTALLCGLMMASAAPLSAEEKTMDRTVTVSATGSVLAAPDEATIATGVTSEAKTARDALTKNTEAMKKVIEELKSQGVEAKDIQTTQFNVEPVYVYPKEGQPPSVTGYRVNNMLGVRVRNLDKLGGVLDQLVTAGANQMNGISFDVSKAETLKDDARKAAMENAKRRAQLLATAAGAEVGEVLQISEETSQQGPRPVVFAKQRAAMAESVPVERGEQELEARVTVTWKLK
ncbi:MAG: SIMPL domain-containing protein [Hyphomicrobium sp.]|nr:SIMPL domain-containing protein [Hyphomicrobium sp.]